MSNWKVIYVSSRAEKKVAERLKEKGIECYLPIKKEMKQWSDRKKMVESPLINGYVFVRPKPLQRDVVLQQQGVLNYVRYNGGDAVVREMEIEALKSIEEKGYHVKGAFSNVFSQGDKVKIEYGPFKGLYGSVKAEAKQHVFYIAIEGIGYTLTVKVPDEVLAKIKCTT